MNAYPMPAQSQMPNQSQPSQNRNHAGRIITAAKSLLPHLEAGRALEATHMRAAMENAFRASDADGAWVWKDAYEATEIAQILMMMRFGNAMQKHAGSQADYIDGSVCIKVPRPPQRISY